MPDNRKDALDEIQRLAGEHGLTATDIAQYLNQDAPDTHPSKTSQGVITRTLLSYTGGLFVFAGLGLLVSMIWDDMSGLQRVIATFGVGLVAFILGLFAHKDERFETAVTPLFLIAGFMQPGGLFVFLDEFFPEAGDPQLASSLIFSVMALQNGIVFKVLERTSLLFLALCFWGFFLATTLDLLNWDRDYNGLVTGLSLFLITVFVSRSPHKVISAFWYFVSGAVILGCSFAIVEGTVFDLGYLALNGFMVYLSIQLASRTLLFVSAVGLLGYLGYFTYEYFADVTGWPVALIVMGLVMLGSGSVLIKCMHTAQVKFLTDVC